jgi:hypothetical protein
MGGLAMAVWKYVRATRDVDLLLSLREERVGEVLRGLREAGIRPKGDPAKRTIGHFDVVQLLYEPPEAFVDVQVDLLLGAGDYHQAAMERRLSAQLPDLDVEIAVLTCEDLVLHKLLAGRVIDRVDAAALLKANRPSLDTDYVARWACSLNVAAELAEAWNEAFPKTTPPW